ncbi:DUF2691 family protein [Paenibacillus chartarius]|uniref:DUF2691 family protein n=1 Tax=Paenibacillus chartarius TaxID=747481 RepID=A0ABV6DLB4_9BACL
MIRGIRFELPNPYGRILGDILKPLHAADFRWYIGGVT